MVNIHKPNVQDLNYELLSDKADSHLTLNVILENNQSVYGTEYNSNEVNIEWYKTDSNISSNNKLEEKTYIIHYVEGPQMNNNVKIIYTRYNFFKFNLDTKQQEEIDNNIPILNSDTTYLFKVYEIKMGEYSKESNILSVST